VYDPIFENRSENTHRCPHKDYSSLTRWEANRDLLSVSTFYNLLFVTTHLCQGKNVSILPPGDVNLRPITSRRGLLEDSPYRAVGGVVRHAMSYDLVPRGSRDLGMSCGHFHKT
jgi:hypothetical protein